MSGQRTSELEALTVEWRWQPLGRVTLVGDDIVTPATTAIPAIYRWILRHGDAERQYIGEAQNLQRRFAGYRRPGLSQSTNRRMNDRVRRTLAAGGSVAIDLIREASVTVDGTRQDADLSSPFTRRLIENAVLVRLLSAGTSIVNGRGYGAHSQHEILG